MFLTYFSLSLLMKKKWSMNKLDTYTWYFMRYHFILTSIIITNFLCIHTFSYIIGYNRYHYTNCVAMVTKAIWSPVKETATDNSFVSVATIIPPSAVSKVNLDLSSLLDGDDKKSKNKRGVLPKHATNIMRSWLFQHLMVGPCFLLFL